VRAPAWGPSLPSDPRAAREALIRWAHLGYRTLFEPALTAPIRLPRFAWRLFVRWAWRHLFGCDDRHAVAGAIVLADLDRHCRGHRAFGWRSTFEVQRLEGRREVYLRVAMYANMSDADLQRALLDQRVLVERSRGGSGP